MDIKQTISIVTPSFQQGQYIERTIQSVLNQKGDFYIDYIIQDGGSKDDSVGIIKKYELLLQKNSKILKKDGLVYYVKNKAGFEYNNCLGISYRWVSQKDAGQVDALLKGFAICQGTILNWLNSDDVFYNDRVFDRIVTLFHKNPELELITADGDLIDENDKIIGKMIIPRIDVNELLYLDYHVLQPSTFFMRELYEKNKKHLLVDMACAFDANFFSHIFSEGVKSMKLCEMLSCYRFYPDIKTLSLSERRFKEQMQVTYSISRNPFLNALSYVYRYLEIIQKPKISNSFFQNFFVLFRRLCYTVVTGHPDRIYAS